MRKLFSLIGCLVFGVSIMMAQNKTITGRVISEEDGEPIIGATVLVTGTTTGTTTDIDGRFSINVSADVKTLSFSYVGMSTVDAPVKDKMRITLSTNRTVLDDVVVTAQGISRSERTLGYAATTLKNEDIAIGNTSNAMTSLQGKVAGLSISTQSSAPGATQNVIIRGISSINGSNQPLYVVDGVPMQQTVTSGYGQNLAAGGVANIAPEDIDNMTVLKGAAATALYGSRAANGVILITTKSGKRGVGRNFSINYSYGLQAQSVSYLPEMQNSWGQGWNGNQTYIENGSWGPELNGSTQVYGPIYNNQQLIHEYSAKKHNVRDFFDTGIQHQHNVQFTGVSEDGKMNYVASYSYTKNDGIMPGSADRLKKNIASMRASYEAAKWLKVSSNISFAKNNINTVGTDQGVTVIDGLYEQARDVSIYDMRNTSSPFYTPQAYYTPYGITNPYWAIENHYYHTDSKQVYGKFQIDAKPYKDVTLMYRFGFDYTDYDRKIGDPQIDLDESNMQENYGYDYTKQNMTGFVNATYSRRYEINHDVTANYQHRFDLGDGENNALDVNVTAGLNVSERAATAMGAQVDDLTFYSGFWDLSNGATKTSISESQSKRRGVGLWATANIGWADKVFLDYNARNDWSSTLPIDANNYFYQGITASYIFTEDLPKNDVLTFGKIRAAYGQTGNDADPYYTSVSYVQGFADVYYGLSVASFPMNGVNAFQRSSAIGSTSLKPEMTTESEFGVNLGFFNGRLGLDASWYNRETDDQIFTLPIDPATGYTSQVTNFGNVRNRGWELVLKTTPVKTANWQWDLNFNWAKNDNKVLSLPESLEGGKVVINYFSAGGDAVYMYAEEGKPIGELYTYLPEYTEDGKVIVGEDGLPIVSTDLVDTGKNVNNKWTAGVNTSLSAYGFTLSAQFDIRYGGYMFSRTKNLMTFTGNGICTSYNERRPFVVPNSVVASTDAAGNTVYVENTTPLHMSDGTIQSYYDGGETGGCVTSYLVDRSFMKLRNVTLTYNLPSRWLKNVFLSGASISLYGNNLLTWTAKDNRCIDPENTTYSQSSYGDLGSMFGELYSNPSCRTYGFNVSLKF